MEIPELRGGGESGAEKKRGEEDVPETKTPLPSRRVSVLCWRVMSSAPSTKIAPPRYRPQSPPEGTPHGFIVTAQQQRHLSVSLLSRREG